MSKQTDFLLKTSRAVIQDCALPNGAIIAANSSKSYFPKEAKNYRFVWPRDAMYTCIAANILGINIQEKFFKWCMKAEGWQKTGLFYEKYFVNGKKALYHFQPDQTGSVLMAIYDYYKNDMKEAKKFEKLIIRSANALCNAWDKDHFKLTTQDIWEGRLCFPDLKENFTYSLAICSKGLSCANELIPNSTWRRTATEMRKTLLGSFTDYFYRSFGRINDERIDASLLGLVWPACLVDAYDERMKKTIAIIEKKLVKNGGVYRFEHDEYDGWMYDKTVCRKKGAGYWPLLNFWMVIYYLKLGDRNRALKYYDEALRYVKGKKHIPEQIFDNTIQVSVSPLCWAHAMFVIASKELGFVLH